MYKNAYIYEKFEINSSSTFARDENVWTRLNWHFSHFLFFTRDFHSWLGTRPSLLSKVTILQEVIVQVQIRQLARTFLTNDASFAYINTHVRLEKCKKFTRTRKNELIQVSPTDTLDKKQLVLYSLKLK